MELYPANFAPDDFRPAIFSARRLPDRLHYRMVRCDACKLVRSDPVIDADSLVALYARSTFDYGSETAALRQTYGRYLSRALAFVPGCHRLLELGCGNGFFLEEALTRGVPEVYGVEPSAEAVAAAASHVRPNIVTDVLRPGLFPEGWFDTICAFQVLDHLADPGSALAECRRLLRPGGIMLCLQHNVEALSARLLREASPIIDIEHTYLYSRATLRRLFERAGYEVLAAGGAWNTYRLDYLLRLVPLPAPLKNALRSICHGIRLGECVLTVPLGNLYQVARRPLNS
jgi:SAM-dependent methyltransferase